MVKMIKQKTMVIMIRGMKAIIGMNGGRNICQTMSGMRGAMKIGIVTDTIGVRLPSHGYCILMPRRKILLKR